MASWNARLERTKSMIAKLPEAVKRATLEQLEKEAEDLAAAITQAAPYDEGETHHEHLKDHIHTAPGRHDLQIRVVADAKDAKGRFIAAPIEFGHMAKGDVHVPAKPFFFPTYRARKKKIKSRLASASRKAFKAW